MLLILLYFDLACTTRPSVSRINLLLILPSLFRFGMVSRIDTINLVLILPSLFRFGTVSQIDTNPIIESYYQSTPNPSFSVSIWHAPDPPSHGLIRILLSICSLSFSVSIWHAPDPPSLYIDEEFSVPLLGAQGQPHPPVLVLLCVIRLAGSVGDFSCHHRITYLGFHPRQLRITQAVPWIVSSVTDERIRRCCKSRLLRLASRAAEDMRTLKLLVNVVTLVGRQGTSGLVHA